MERHNDNCDLNMIQVEGIGNMRMRNQLAKVLSVTSVALVVIATLVVMMPTVRAEPYETGDELASLAVERGFMGTVFGDDGLLYVLGGYSDLAADALDSVLIYDVSAGTTTSGKGMDVGVINPGCVKGNDGKIYVLGGYNDTVIYPLSTQIYDPIANDWTIGANLPRAMYWPAAAVGDDGRIFLFGGYDWGVSINSTLIYDPVADEWDYGADLPTPRYGATAVTLANGSIAVIGGEADFVVLSTVEIYDPVSNSWSVAEPLGTPRRSGGAALGNNGLLYSFGGTGTGGLFAPPSAPRLERSSGGSWDNSDYAPIYARQGFGTAVDKFDRVFIVGGYDGSDMLPNIEYFIASDITESLDLVISAPADGSIVSGTVSVEVILKNGASASPDPVATIDFLVDGVWQETQMGANSWIFLWDSTGLPNLSTHTLTVRAFFYDSTVKEDSVTVTATDRSVEERMASIEQQLADVQTQLADIQSQLAAQDANLTAINLQLAGMMTGLLQIQLALVDLGNGLMMMGAAQAAAMDQLNLTLDGLMLQLNAFQAQVTAIQNSLVGFQTQVNDIDNKTDDFQEQIDRVEDKVDDFQEQVDRVENKADTAAVYGLVTMVLIIVIIVLLALMFMMGRKKP